MRWQSRWLMPGLAGLMLGAGLACDGGSHGDGSRGDASAAQGARKAPASVKLDPVFPALKLERPLLLQFPPSEPNLAVVVEQVGRVSAFDRGGSGGDARVWIDVSKRISSRGEEGLLGMAFDPHFAQNRLVYLYYSAPSPRRSVISRFTVAADLSRIDPASEQVLLEVPQPYANHNGGHIVFGPDGFLYIGLGDGGAGGDPHGNGQNTRALLGKMLRIDVANASSGRQYGIPGDNPFADGQRGAAEIFATGLRNPWRYSFDRKTGRLWAGDVGQSTLEEIDVIERGGNYGWNTMEGDICFKSERCDQKGLTLPIAVYGRNDGISVTGGYVYRGKKLPRLEGQYIFGDYGSGRIWSFSSDVARPATPLELVDTESRISSFAEDLDGELYVIDHGGALYRLAALP